MTLEPEQRFLVHPKATRSAWRTAMPASPSSLATDARGTGITDIAVAHV